MRDKKQSAVAGAWLVTFVLGGWAGLILAAPLSADDPRNAVNGLVIPDEGYCDQPYIVVTKDGDWLCTMTTGPGIEGQGGQHVVCTVSKDKGRNWSKLMDIEPSDGPEASWVIPLMTPSGRIYAFYDFNGDRVDTLGDKKGIRADMLGWYCYRYSDDKGKSWSKRYRLPVRLTACDRTNDWQGKVQIFWGIDKPMVADGVAYFGFTKLGRYLLDLGEGWLFRSDNILTEPDVDKIHWEMLPAGDRGIRNEAFGSVQEEHNIVPLSDGSLYCMYRTTTGHPCHAYSRDGGRTWNHPAFATHRSYTLGSQVFKHPRACPMIWRAGNGKFLFWFHNHGGKSFTDRNPVWICGGVEEDHHIRWGQPEILIYDHDLPVKMSYPDLVEQDGRYWVTETNKSIARIHEIAPAFLEGLWNQGQDRTVARDGLALSCDFGKAMPKTADMPRISDLREGAGLTLDCWVTFDDLSADQVILDTRDAAGKGLALTTTEVGTVEISLSDGTHQASWDCDPGLLRPGNLHHLGIVVDPGPRIITFVVDGMVCDGGTFRQYGWGRFPAELGDINGSGTLTIAPSLKGRLEGLRVYTRYLRNSEVIANYHACEVLPPRISAEKQEYVGSQAVMLEMLRPDREVRYTTDGSEPTWESSAYTRPFTLNGAATVKARAFWDNGQKAGRTATAVFTPIPARKAETVAKLEPGLICTGYKKHVQKVPNFAELTPAWTRTVEKFEVPGDTPAIHFALRFEGYVRVPHDGLYTFTTTSDDGTILWIGDTKVVDNDGVHFASRASGRIALEAGLHKITVGYFQEHNTKELTVGYEGPNLWWEEISPKQLFHVPDAK